MRLVRSVLLSLVAAGLLTASAMTQDAFLAQWELLVGCGSFGLAWLTT